MSNSGNSAVVKNLQFRRRQYKYFVVVKSFVMELSCQIEVFFNTAKFYFELRRNILLEGEFR